VSTVTQPGATNSLADALKPVRAELLRRAREEAAQRVREATAAAEQSVRQAEEEAARILAEARAEGAADAAAAAAAQQARSRRTARAAVLAARSELVRRSADALRGEPVDRLVALATALLGEPVQVTSAEGGGVVATAGDRRVDLSLDALAERATRLLGPDVEGLWRP
jgi:F0F1-type ATP synthase membrane subunit b/b'